MLEVTVKDATYSGFFDELGKTIADITKTTTAQVVNLEKQRLLSKVQQRYAPKPAMPTPPPQPVVPVAPPEQRGMDLSKYALFGGLALGAVILLAVIIKKKKSSEGAVVAYAPPAPAYAPAPMVPVR